MAEHSKAAVEAAARHPLANAYAALAEWKLGRIERAQSHIKRALEYDPMNELAAYVDVLVKGQPLEMLWRPIRSDRSQTALDIAYDLHDAGFDQEAIEILRAVETPTTPMVAYTLGYLLEKTGQSPLEALAAAATLQPRNTFPYRLYEIRVLNWALRNEKDAKAHDLLACVLYDKGHFQRAVQLWREARRIDPTSALYARNLAVALFSHLHQRNEALELLVEAMELDPSNDQLKQEFLYAATKSGMDGERRIEIIQAHPLAGKPKDDFILEYAKAHCAAGRYDEAEKIMLGHEFVPAEGGERAITSLYYAIRLRKGRKALRDGRAEEALEIFSALHEKLPENLHAGNWAATELVPVYYYEAVALDCLGRVEESRTLYQRIADRLSPGLGAAVFFCPHTYPCAACCKVTIHLSSCLAQPCQRTSASLNRSSEPVLPIPRWLLLQKYMTEHVCLRIFLYLNLRCVIPFVHRNI